MEEKERGAMRAEDAAQYIGVSRTTLWRLVREGQIPKPLDVGSRTKVYRRNWLDAFLDRKEAEQAAKV